MKLCTQTQDNPANLMCFQLIVQESSLKSLADCPDWKSSESSFLVKLIAIYLASFPIVPS